MGVAVIGSASISGYHSALDARVARLGLSSRELTEVRGSLGGALKIANGFGGETGRTLRSVSRAAYVQGMHLGVGAGAVLVGVSVILALRYLPATAHDPITAAPPPEPSSRGAVPETAATA